MFLPISHRFVRKTLSEHNLLEPLQKKKRQPPKPKAFERARPNQLWQSDITAFQIAKGLRVYLIGFMDDHSRYMVGCEKDRFSQVPALRGINFHE